MQTQCRILNCVSGDNIHPLERDSRASQKKGFDCLEWSKNTIHTTASGTEIVSALLIDMGIYGVEIHNPSEMEAFLSGGSQGWDYIDEKLMQPTSCQNKDEASVVFYLGTDCESQELLTRIKESLQSLPNSLVLSSLTSETVNDQDWLHEWKKHFHPFKIGNVLIVPEWEAANHKNDGVVFTIDPGLAFGTGQHATTMLCIQALQERLPPGAHVLDIGCGSGILSIISLLLGAKDIVACDIDPAAVEITRKNAGLNPINPSSLEVYAGDILSNPALQENVNRKKYDIIVANIVADVIIRLAPLVKTLLAPGGTFIASGIIDERLEDVQSALAANDIAPIETKKSEGWCLVTANG